MSFRWGSKVTTIGVVGAASALAVIGLIWVGAQLLACMPERVL